MAAKKFTLTILALSHWACSPINPNEGESMSREEAVQLAREHKAILLSESSASERANFASDVVSTAEQRDHVTGISFKGKDARTLVASFIYDGKDCLVGFSYR
ncbi:hypothetical protein K3172_07190 [Qipengyuania sp. 6B39]|uniref:hypothetical protein n=1 Tax=Qipengyuania proteolytica TaxID=2867239 RepID=UPI001C8A11C9|nr:hypothetical protein [Qipengyuania proteolytica]MBX7495643.1 hypothetical protein [Qipengyuania proteolytica]